MAPVASRIGTVGTPRISTRSWVALSSLTREIFPAASAAVTVTFERAGGKAACVRLAPSRTSSRASSTNEGLMMMRTPVHPSDTYACCSFGSSPSTDGRRWVPTICRSSISVARRDSSPDASAAHLARCEVDVDAARANDPRRAPGAPEDRADPRDQLARTERLGHVVVGARSQSLELVLLRRPRRDHDDRNVGSFTKRPADIETGEPGEHEIEDDEIRRTLGGGGEGVGAGVREIDLVPGVAQVQRDRLLRARIVLDHQNATLHRDA